MVRPPSPPISFSATSPELTAVADNDFLFRTALSDVSQGPVLAHLARERGFGNVGLLHVDDPWGRGLAGAFEAAWDGPVKAVLGGPRSDRLPDRAARVRERGRSGSGGDRLRDGRPDHGPRGDRPAAFTTTSSSATAPSGRSLVRSLGGARLGNMYGTGSASAPESEASAAWEAAYVAEYGALPVLAYVKEAYDATVALALAAQAASRLDGAEIRDRLRAVCSSPGTVVNAGPSGVADALRILANGGEIDYEGASGSIDWDGNGDLRSGHIGVWRFTEDERIEEMRAVAFEE